MTGHDKKTLEAGLAYLACHKPELVAAKLTGRTFAVRQFHGDRDLVAPAGELARLPEVDPIILPRMGHAPFAAAPYRNLPEIRRGRLARRFSRAASSYDHFADIQKECRNSLAARLPKRAENILELGCGTGGLSVILRETYPSARLTVVELSREMLEIAEERIGQRKAVTFCGAAETFISSSDEQFDLIVSGAAMHWFEDLEDVLADCCARLLSPSGRLLASLFGPRSLAGLNRALAAAGGGPVAAAAFPGRDELSAMLDKFFARANLEETLIHRTYPSTLALLRQLQKTGTSGVEQGRLTPAMIKKMDLWFRENMGKVMDSYQVFFLEGQGRK